MSSPYEIVTSNNVSVVRTARGLERVLRQIATSANMDHYVEQRVISVLMQRVSQELLFLSFENPTPGEVIEQRSLDTYSDLKLDSGQSIWDLKLGTGRSLVFVLIEVCYHFTVAAVTRSRIVLTVAPRHDFLGSEKFGLTIVVDFSGMRVGSKKKGFSKLGGVTSWS